MPTRLFAVGALVAFCLLIADTSAEACGKRSAPAPVYYHCHYDPCHHWHHWHHCHPCHPCHGPVYVVSPPPVPLYSTDDPKPKVRVVPFGKGVIVEFTVPSGIPPQSPPTGTIHVTKLSGAGEMKYEGYNKRHEHPSMPGATQTVYSVFLLPTKAGMIEVKVEFVLANGTTQPHTLAFDVTPPKP